MKTFCEPATYSILHRGIKGYIDFVQMPESQENIVNLASLQNLPALLEAWNRHLQSLPELMNLYQNNYQPPVIKLQSLLKLPVGTVGQTFASQMLLKGFDPDYPFSGTRMALEGDNLVSYIQNLRLKTHDLHHLVTGFDTSIAGEVGLTMVYFFQLRAPVSAFVLGGTLTHCVLEPEWYAPVIAAMNYGLKIGETSQNLLAIKWEQQWEKPLQTLREEIGIIPPGTECSSADLENQINNVCQRLLVNK